jgi:hypothetical protein
MSSLPATHGWRRWLTTKQEAQELRRQTAEDCAQLRAEAQADAQQVREAADAYAQQVGATADDDARRAREEAKAEASETIEEGLRRRGQIDDQIHELETHRAGVLEGLGRLRAELGATSTRSGPQRHRTASPPPRRATPRPPSGADAQSSSQAR